MKAVDDEEEEDRVLVGAADITFLVSSTSEVSKR
jgi:hypothetical protein